MALYLYIQLRKVEAQWGDGLKGMRYQQARKALQELEKLDGQEHIKNWRPQVRLPCTCTHAHAHAHAHSHACDAPQLTRRRGMLRACARARARAWFVVQHALVLVKLPALAVLRDAKVACVDEQQRG